MIRPEDVFDRISSNGRRARCPECDDDTVRKQGTVQINGEYAYCHKCQASWDFSEKYVHTVKDYTPVNTKEKVVTQAIEKSGYEDARNNFTAHWETTIQSLELPWTKACLDCDVGVRNNEGNPQLVFHINENHVKYHKGMQFGDAHCKVFETPHLSISDLLICEGEKDVITAYCNGLSAMTFTSGAGALPKKFTLDDRYNRVYIVYDNDEKGQEGALKLAKRLHGSGADLFTIEWGDKPSGYDITDWFNGGNTMKNLLAMCKPFGKNPEDLGGMRSYTPAQFMEKFNVMPEPIIDDLFFERDLLGIAGGTNVGKSVLSFQLAMSLALGVPFLAFRVPKPRKVMHVQFELKDESFKMMMQRNAQHVLAQYPIEANYWNDNMTLLSTGQSEVFQDKWESIDNNLTFQKHDVLIVDNLYTSTAMDTSKNTDVMNLLRTIVDIKNKHKVAIVIVSHHKKMGEQTPLDVSHMLGGSAYSNHLDGILQLATAKRANDLKVMKITKLRCQNDLHNVPCGIKLHNDQDHGLYFEYLKKLPKNEMFWYTDPSESTEEKILNAIMTEGHNFSRESFAQALSDAIGVSSNNAVSRWLDKLINLGLIAKIGHGQYRKCETELDGLLD